MLGAGPMVLSALLGAFFWAAFESVCSRLGVGHGTDGATSGVSAVLLLYVPLRELGRALWVSEFVRSRVLGERTSLAAKLAVAFGVGESFALVLTHGWAVVWLLRGLLESGLHVLAAVWLLRSGASRGRAGGLYLLGKRALAVALVRVPLSYLILCRSAAMATCTLPVLLLGACLIWFYSEHEPLADGQPNSMVHSLRSGVPSMPQLRIQMAAQRAALRPIWVLLGMPIYAGALVAGIGVGGASARSVGFNVATIDDTTGRGGAAFWLLAVVLAFYALAGGVHLTAAKGRAVLECALACLLSFVFVWLLVGISGFTALLICATLSPLAIVSACFGGWFAKRWTAGGARVR